MMLAVFQGEGIICILSSFKMQGHSDMHNYPEIILKNYA